MLVRPYVPMLSPRMKRSSAFRLRVIMTGELLLNLNFSILAVEYIHAPLLLLSIIHMCCCNHSNMRKGFLHAWQGWFNIFMSVDSAACLKTQAHSTDIHMID